MAIIKLEPPVNKDDFGLLATELQRFFTEVHRAYVAEIQPCPLGDGYVRLGSPLERERFLGLVFTFGSYAMTVLKHDEAENARSFDLDREAWVMLVGFPEDLKNTVVVAKAVSGFGILVHWHETENLARVVAKVYLNNEAKIPDSVKVNVGLPPKRLLVDFTCFCVEKKLSLKFQMKKSTSLRGPFSPCRCSLHAGMVLLP